LNRKIFCKIAPLDRPLVFVAGAVPSEAAAFLAAVIVCAALLLLFFLYINKALCFRLCPDLSALWLAARLRRVSVKQTTTSSGRLSRSIALRARYALRPGTARIEHARV